MNVAIARTGVAEVNNIPLSLQGCEDHARTNQPGGRVRLCCTSNGPKFQCLGHHGHYRVLFRHLLVHLDQILSAERGRAEMKIQSTLINGTPSSSCSVYSRICIVEISVIFAPALRMSHFRKLPMWSPETLLHWPGKFTTK